MVVAMIFIFTLDATGINIIAERLLTAVGADLRGRADSLADAHAVNDVLARAARHQRLNSIVALLV